MNKQKTGAFCNEKLNSAGRLSEMSELLYARIRLFILNIGSQRSCALHYISSSLDFNEINVLQTLWTRAWT